MPETATDDTQSKTDPLAAKAAVAAFFMAQVGGIGACFGMEWTPLYGLGVLVVVALVVGIWALRRLRRVRAKDGPGWAVAAIYISVFMFVMVPVSVFGMTTLGSSFVREPIETDMHAIGGRLQEYSKAHGDLTPGGPVLAVAGDEKSTEVVTGPLTMAHLFGEKVRRHDRKYYRLTTTGKNSATVEFRVRVDDEDPSATMTVTDARDGVFEIEFHD